jgi:glycosyltransferase involved in cell wall biosynthesis
MRVAVLFARLGPYHHARLRAVAQHMNLVAVEYSNVDRTYAWQPVTGQTSFAQRTLFKDRAYQEQSTLAQKAVIETCLDRIQPSVVAIAGWSNPIALLALSCCGYRGIPTVLMSESTEHDEARQFGKEIIKRQVLKNVSSGLVGGQLHQSYLVKLGVPANRVFLGYDVVDNAHFTNGAAHARQSSLKLRAQLGLPERYFLASSRFVEKKNLKRLLNAYARYRAKAGVAAWGLVLLGDGMLKPALRALISQLDLKPWVQLPGFKQYDELPAFYGLADCFIHASTTEQWGLVVNEAMASGLPVLVSNCCGCAPDLIQNGRNGYTFDPYDVDELATLMLKIPSEECDRIAMCHASQEIITHWSPQTFAENLQKAIETALATPRRQASPFDRALLWALSRRQA